MIRRVVYAGPDLADSRSSPEKAACARRERDAMSSEEELLSPKTGGRPKDIAWDVKVDAVIMVYYTMTELGIKKTPAIEYVARERRLSTSALRDYCLAWERGDVDDLKSRRDNCGSQGNFSPGKAAKIGEIMEKYEYDPAIRDVAAGLDVSYETARRWIAKSEWQLVSKRTKTILSDQCKRDRQMYCEENWDNDFMRDMHGDEKLFVLMPGGSSGRHVR